MTGEDSVSKMVNMLRGGAVMLAEACPACHMPLFKLRSGEVYCVACDKRVIIVKEGEESDFKVLQVSTVESLSRTAFAKLAELSEAAKHEGDVDRLYELARCLTAWLEVLDRVKRLREGL
ncbi:MAG: Sjogren's syndrome/scleroderma autoantigen 1 family protein [Candidatus Nezhaarchaeales archaeon]